ncbi:MAG: YggS family pyridoxal phosphate-dependent enzyme [Acholeplasma sp.]|nr:YggS family pyridoxal phosphate-dependent enzyme [Acholeplasma sp.]
MSNLKKNTKSLLEEISEYPNVSLICASKYLSAPMIKEVYEAGVTHFGENHVQSLQQKLVELKDLNICWHFIGHLQTNKVKTIINQIDYLHSLDRLSLAKSIQKYRDTELKCFVEVNLSKEPSKSGIFEEALTDFLNLLKEYDKIKVVGLMTMGVLDDLEKTNELFIRLSKLKKEFELDHLSMGMTDDYPLAIKAGSDFIRIGRKFIL